MECESCNTKAASNGVVDLAAFEVESLGPTMNWGSQHAIASAKLTKCQVNQLKPVVPPANHPWRSHSQRIWSPQRSSPVTNRRGTAFKYVERLSVMYRLRKLQV